MKKPYVIIHTLTSLDGNINSIDFAVRLGLDTGVMSAIREVYSRASAMGLGPRDVAAVYEAVNPRK